MLIQIQFVIEMGFISLICDKKIGGTHLTALACILNISRFLPSSIGLYFLSFMNYYFYAIFAIVYSIIMLIATKKWSLYLDNADIKEFRLTEEEHNGFKDRQYHSGISTQNCNDKNSADNLR